MTTPAAKRAIEHEQRKLTTMLLSLADVHCQICERPIQAAKGVLAHHGYQRPQYGSGWQTASCFGARALPYEVSADLLPLAIEKVRAWKLSIEERLAKLEGTPEIANPAHTAWLQAKIKGKLRRKDGTDHPEPAKTLLPVLTPWSQDDPRDVFLARHAYTRALEDYRRDATGELRDATEELARLEARLAAWAPVTLAQQQAIALASTAKKTAPPEPGSRAAIIAANKAKRAAKEAAFLASIELPCAHGSNPRTCKVHGHGSNFWNDPGLRRPMTMCDVKRDYLAKKTGNRDLW